MVIFKQKYRKKLKSRHRANNEIFGFLNQLFDLQFVIYKILV